jgi:periplasmic protein TonB
MIAMTPPRFRNPRPARRTPRKPRADRFAALRLRLDAPGGGFPRTAGRIVAVLLACGTSAGFLWPQARFEAEPAETLFVMEEEIPPPPPPSLPPPPDPAPPPPPPPEAPPSPPRFGLEAEALGEAGDLAVAAGNTVMKEAEPELAPPPPPLPPAPVFVDQAPRILSGTPPEYPPGALDRNLEATVVVLIAIDTNGAVTEAAIEKSGGLDFDGAVLKSARATRFQPPTRQGRKVPARFRRPYAFELE